MDLSGPQSLSAVLQDEELKLVPEVIQKKLIAYIEKFYDEYCKERAAAHRQAEAEQRAEDLQNRIDDYLVKFTNFEQNVQELRTQLDQVSAERAQLLEKVNSYDQSVSDIRKDKNSIVEERDSLMKVIERQNGELERLKQDVHMYQNQLSNAIAAKCEAIAKVDEVQSKEVALDIKERRLESERAMLQQEIQLVTGDLNRTSAEVQNIRRENSINTLHLEARLKEKTDEVQLLQTQNAQSNKTIEDLNRKIEELNDTIYQHNMATEKYVDTLKKELDAKEKLVEIYKSTDGENVAERNELLQGISDMKRMLNEATEEYGRLENDMLVIKEKHGQEVTELNKTIDSLRQEILHANDLLKQSQEQSLENAICKIAPSAAVASRLLKSDLSLTELYSMYAKSQEDLELKNRENAQLKLQIKSILEEISENVPRFEKQTENLHKLSESNDVLIQQRDELMESKLSLDHELEKTRFNLNNYARENRKLKQTQSDLSRQVCMLLDEVNCLRAGVTRKRQEDHGVSGDDISSQGLINKNLVTFESITEMQENNAKLLALVRELTTSLEEYEENNDKLALQQTEEKLKKATERFADMEEVLAQKNQTVQTLLAKCERYKKFFFDAQKKLGKTPIDLDDSNAEINDSLFDTSANAKAERTLSQEESEKLERRIRQLQEQVEEETKKYASLKENYDYYTSEKRKNDALAQDQFDAMRKEVRELTSANCKLLNASEFQKEQIEMLHKNTETYKQQINALEDRTKNYEKTIIKHEQTVHMLKDEVMSAHRKQAAADAEAHNLRHENRVLKDTASRLQIEREGYQREHMSQSLLLNNLEYIKSNLERSEAEGRLRVEQRLDDTLRELAAQRRHFQEEEEKFRETVNELKRQTETAIKLKEEEKQQAEKWQAELVTVREELAQKIEQLNELSKKLQESLTPSINENPITAANKKAREFELKFEQAKVEIESLTKEVAKAREHGQQFYKMSQTGESEIKRLHDMHTETVQKLEEQIKQLKNSEAELQTRITDLEAEALLSNVTEQSKNINQSDQLKLAQEELKNVLEKLTESQRTVRELRSSNTDLAESLTVVEVKYANEMVLHSADIQELAKFKSDFFKLQDELNSLKSGRESLQTAHDELVKSNAEAQKLLDKEKANSESRVADLTALNSTLHDQIEALTTKLAAITQSAASLNESSLLEQSSSQMDISGVVSGEDNKNNEQLLNIIKFLRKEKDIFAAKLDILKAENARLVSEHTIQQKKVDELNGYLNQERSKSQTDVISANKHEEVLRKIETLNAITDSNRILREERNNLTRRVTELTDRISSVEKELFPLQCSNKELTSKIEELNVENTSLRTEAIKWRQRANALVEKSNRNPEEFKRLQSEREHLAKLLTSEKELCRKQQEEVTQLKTRLDTEVNNMVKAMHTQNEANKKLTDEAVVLRQANGRQTAELMELKNRLLQKEEQLMKANEDLETKDKAIQDKDTKELQLRKLAKRYKDYYMGLQAQTGQTADTISELEKVRSELDEVNGQLRACKEDQEKLTQANEELKKRVEPQTDAANAAVRQEYKAKLDKLVLDLTVARTDLANQETSFAGTRTIYDESIARLEKELQDTITANKEVNLRLTRENEALHMRVNQLTRQLGTQQSTKPSTSSVAEKGNISESSPRTANVKPMSGSAMATVQQSATVQPWRGGETPLASIRPISLQNRTAAILPTSQQPSAGSASTSTSTSTSSSSSTSTTTSSASASSGSSSAVANTALVPPQQQVHTTAGSATLESMASSSPTSSHTDYMPSTSSAAVAVAAIPPMGASSAAESSQEAESIQHSQQNDSQLFAGGSGAQQQVVALVSPRVEGSSSTSTSTSTATSATSATVPNVQQDASTQQQPSTSGSSSSSSTVVSSHSRHTPSSSSVTTTQAVKRPRDVEGDSSTNADGEGVPEKMVKLTKRLRAPMHSGELSAGHIGDSGMDVDQMPTSSQRDQEDEIQVVDSDDEEEDVLVEGDAIDGGEAEQVGYEDSYEQDNDMMDDNENGDDEHVMAADAQDNNEVDIEDTQQQQLEAQEESQLLDSQAVAAVAASVSHQENNQSQAITSGSGESSNPAASTSSSAASARRNESDSVEIVSSVEQPVAGADVAGVQAKDVPQESAGTSSVDAGTSSAVASSPQKTSEAAGGGAGDGNVNEANKLPDMSGSASTGAEHNASEADEAFAEETEAAHAEESQQQAHENQNVGTSQSSDVSENQGNQGENPAEENEGTDGVSSEGEKQAVEVEEEGREAEATSPSENTRYRTLRSGVPTRRGGRSMNRGNTANNPNRPPRIVYGESSPGVSLRQDQGGPNNRIFAPRTRSRRPLRRPAPNNFNNGGRYQ
ncbi:LOW QUALITY PROTEIN: nucleoprotein TPR [Drosophila tropicalis]|uniref:LOW QUALITY PROTEIN: nucleoprotein TPR n=1 Tax=Drosophila tropicalis TaxID=46794 RepID=UPI0035ABF286